MSVTDGGECGRVAGGHWRSGLDKAASFRFAPLFLFLVSGLLYQSQEDFSWGSRFQISPAQKN